MNADPSHNADPQPTAPPAAVVPIRDRFRIRFAKVGLLRWIGHRDLQRLWERLLRRVDLPLALTEGFHPKPRIAFPSALALGVEGLDEVVEIEVTREIHPTELRDRLIADEQPGLEIGEVRLVARAAADGTPDPSFPNLAKARLHSSGYEIEIPAAYAAEIHSLAEIDQRIAQARTAGEIRFARKDQTVTASFPRPLAALERQAEKLRLTIVEDAGTSLKPTEVLAAIGLGGLIEHGGILRRTRVMLVDELIDPPAALSGGDATNPVASNRINPPNTLVKESS